MLKAKADFEGLWDSLDKQGRRKLLSQRLKLEAGDEYSIAVANEMAANGFFLSVRFGMSGPMAQFQKGEFNAGWWESPDLGDAIQKAACATLIGWDKVQGEGQLFIQRPMSLVCEVSAVEMAGEPINTGSNGQFGLPKVDKAKLVEVIVKSGKPFSRSIAELMASVICDSKYGVYIVLLIDRGLRPNERHDVTWDSLIETTVRDIEASGKAFWWLPEGASGMKVVIRVSADNVENVDGNWRLRSAWNAVTHLKPEELLHFKLVG